MSKEERARRQKYRATMSTLYGHLNIARVAIGKGIIMNTNKDKRKRK